MKKEKLEKSRKIYSKIASFAFLAIPIGLLVWLFDPVGWKLSVGGIIVFLTMLLFVYGIDCSISNLDESGDDK